MFNSDFSKMFDPSQYAQNIQKMCDMTQAMTASKQNMETMKKVSSIVADTVSTCTEKQFKYAQNTMEDCIECLRELSTAKGVEDYMQKQAEISKRTAEKCQSMAQDIASQWQKSQAQCTELLSKQMSNTMEWGKQFAGQTSGTSSK